MLDVYKFRIDVKDDINKCRKVLPITLYLARYCWYVVFKKIKCNSCKSLISGRHNEEISEINSYFYRKFNDSPIWVVRENKQRGKTFKYVYIRSAKEMLKHIPLAVNRL